MRWPSTGTPVAWFTVLMTTGTLVGCGWQAQVASSTPRANPTAGVHWKEIAEPQGVDIPSAKWVQIEGARGVARNIQIAAVLSPQGSGPFPLVVWLHGGEGFHVGDVTRAAPLTAAGLMLLVGCWQYTPPEPTLYRGESYPTIPCLHLNTVGTRQPGEPDPAVEALLAVGRQLPGVRKHAIGLFGVSRGGPEALNGAGLSPDIRAVVVDSTLAGPDRVAVPVLMLGATADDSVSIQSQKDYEQVLRAHGTRVEAHYYDGGEHGVTYFGPFVDDAIHRTADFFVRYLSA
jgi:dipeptidyl aminopeptidase/acylaminoacyl peptidase